MLWTGFHKDYLNILVHELFFYSEFLMSPSVPAPEKHLHSTRPLPAHFTWDGYSAGDEQSWFPSNMMLGIEVSSNQKILFFQSLMVL